MESAQTDALGHRRGKKRGDEEWFGPMRMNREGDSAKAASTAASAARPDATPPTEFDEPADAGAGIVTGAGTTVTPAIATSGGRPQAGIVTGAGGPPRHANAQRTQGRRQALMLRSASGTPRRLPRSLFRPSGCSLQRS